MCDHFLGDLNVNVPLITGLGLAPLASWDRERESDVVQELLKYSSDKAYGRRGTVLRPDFYFPAIRLCRR